MNFVFLLRRFASAVLPVCLWFALYGQGTIKISLVPASGRRPFAGNRLLGKIIDRSDSGFKLNKSLIVSAVWQFGFDSEQTAFIDYIEGGRKDSDFIVRMRVKGWDTMLLSHAPLKNSLFVCSGIDQQGEFVIIPDCNGNRDFTDDKVYRFPYFLSAGENKDSLLSGLKYTTVKIPVWTNGKVIEKSLTIRFIPRSLISLKFSDPLADSVKVAVEVPGFKDGKSRINGVDKIFYVENGTPTENVHENSQKYYDIFITEDSLLDFKRPVPSYMQNKVGDTIPIRDRLYRIEEVGANADFLLLKYVGLNHNLGIIAGTTAKDFEARDIVTKRLIKLSEFRGKFVLLDFWGTWCAPCREMVPELKQINDKFGKTELEIISIAFDDQPEQVAKYVDEERIPWFNIYQSTKQLSGTIVRTYKVENYPTFVLIDRGGKIIFREYGLLGFAKLGKLLRQGVITK